MAITAVPLDNSRSAAEVAPVMAAAHLVVLALSSATSAVLLVPPTPPPGAVPDGGVPPDGPPPMPPPMDVATGPELGMEPVCAWDAVATAYPAEPVRPMMMAAASPT